MKDVETIYLYLRQHSVPLENVPSAPHDFAVHFTTNSPITFQAFNKHRMLSAMDLPN